MTVVLGLALAADRLTRDGARDDARRELTDRRYHADDPSLPARLLSWLQDQVMSLINHVQHVTGASAWWLLGILLAVIAVVVVIRVKLGPLSRRARSSTALDSDATLGATDHRRLASEHTRAGRWADAVREHMRAIATDLEERTIVPPRPGRTAHELATEAGPAIGDGAAALRTAAELFDTIWFGGREATAEHARTLAEADRQIRRIRATHPAQSPESESESFTAIPR